MTIFAPKKKTMQRKKGIYDLVFYKTTDDHEQIVSAVDWKMIQNRLTTDYKEFINVKDQEHTTAPYFKVITSMESPGKEKDREEYFYTRKK
jgi:hypothetical protein